MRKPRRSTKAPWTPREQLHVAAINDAFQQLGRVTLAGFKIEEVAPERRELVVESLRHIAGRALHLMAEAAPRRPALALVKDTVEQGDDRTGVPNE